MKFIKITTDLEVTAHEFPTGGYQEQNDILHKHIGETCELTECVMPERLYSEMGCSKSTTGIDGECVVMLIDEESQFYRKLKENIIGSYLYGTDKHNVPINGTVLLVGEKWVGDGTDICGIEENKCERLKAELQEMADAMKWAQKELSKKKDTHVNKRNKIGKSR